MLRNAWCQTQRTYMAWSLTFNLLQELQEKGNHPNVLARLPGKVWGSLAQQKGLRNRGPREMWKFDYHKIAQTHPIELAEDDFIRDKLASTWLLTTSAAKPWE